MEAFELFGGSDPGSDWQRILAVADPASGLRALVVLHSLARGPAFGGVRRLAYASEREGLADAKRLSEAMSLKCAIAGLPAGGGKAIIFDGPDLDASLAYEALGRAIEGLGGQYVCGPDVGTGARELAALRRETRFVNPEQNDAGRSTAAGVLAGLRGLSAVVFGDASLGGRRYVVQGLGAVGSALAHALIDSGASVAGWDPDAGARERARAIGVELLDGEHALLCEPCEVFMPCALGHTLTPDLCERAPWRAVCGSANNQFSEHAAAMVLHGRGIAWAPDFVVNAGAVIEGVETVLRPTDDVRERVAHSIAAIAERCASLLERARDEDRSPQEVAVEVARAALSQTR